MAETELQLNASITGNIRLPYSLFKMRLYPNGGRKLRPSEILLYGTMYSFSDPKKKTRCNLSYNKFEEKLNLSRRTVANGISELKSAEKIEQDKSRRSCASYECTERPKDKGYISVDLYLYHTKFIVQGKAEPQYLTNTEINVLCLMKTHCANEKGAGVFVGSVRGIAGTLNVCTKAVQDSIETLMKAGLIRRTKEGVNGKIRSEYTVNEKLLRRMQKKARKAEEAATVQDKRTESERAADSRTDFERHYAERQRTAQNRVEWFEERLRKDDTYKRTEGKIRALDIQIARAETYGGTNLEALKRKEIELKGKLARRMAEMNISMEDLIPRYQCSKCSDTGYLPNGQICDCYPKGERKP